MTNDELLRSELRQAYFGVDAVCGNIACTEITKKQLIEVLNRISDVLGESGESIVKMLWPK